MSKLLVNIAKAQVVAFLNAGKCSRKVAEMFGVSVSTVIRTKQMYERRKSFEHAGDDEAPSKHSDYLIGTILVSNEKNPKLSLRKLSEVVEETTGMEVCHSTIENYLNAHEIYASSQIKNPLLTRKHQIERFEPRQIYLMVSLDVQKSIIFSDESDFNLFYNDSKPFVWRPRSTGLKKTCHLMKHLAPGREKIT